MNWIFFLFIATAYAGTVWQQCHWDPSHSPLSPMHLLTEQFLHSAHDAVTLTIGLIGVLAFFLGLMRIAQAAGLLNLLSQLIYPLLRKLFPEIPANHPAFGAMLMNLSANILGLGNAATPFGLKAMQELKTLNPHPGVASNAMVLFLAINTSCFTLIPTKIIALRVSAGSQNAAAIIASTLLASIITMLCSIAIAKYFQTWFTLPTVSPSTENPQARSPEKLAILPWWANLLFLAFLFSLIPLTLFFGKRFSNWLLPTFLALVFVIGITKKVNLFDQFVQGAKEGLDTAIRILPFLIAMLVSVGMLRQSGVLAMLTQWLNPFTQIIGLPADALPMVFMRPLSGAGSYGLLSEILNNPDIGPDSYTGYLVSTLMGSTETTFYVLAVYFGSVQIMRLRHAVLTGILADIVSVIASLIAVNLLLY